MSGTATAPAGWDAEHAVDTAQAAALVHAQFPALAGAPVRELASGWDNTVFLVGEQWVFRFPRRAVALAGTEREMALLPKLAPRLPLAVPVPELTGRPAGGYPWPFWGARHLPGRELMTCGLPERRRVAAAAALGEFLRARTLAVFLCAALADYASSIGHAEMLREALRGLHRAVA